VGAAKIEHEKTMEINAQIEAEVLWFNLPVIE
jgi:hypothetical protein